MFLFVSGGADMHEGDLEMENTVQRVRVFVCVCVRVFLTSLAGFQAGPGSFSS